MGISPSNIPPERSPQAFQRTMGPDVAGRTGPLRFEEGLATDSDVPSDFVEGMGDGYQTGPGSPNHNNPDSQYKHADQVMAERAHVGSASWVDAPSMLSDFVGGVTEPPVTYPEVRRSGGRYERNSPETVTDYGLPLFQFVHHPVERFWGPRRLGNTHPERRQ